MILISLFRIDDHLFGNGNKINLKVYKVFHLFSILKLYLNPFFRLKRF